MPKFIHKILFLCFHISDNDETRTVSLDNQCVDESNQTKMGKKLSEPPTKPNQSTDNQKPNNNEGKK